MPYTINRSYFSAAMESAGREYAIDVARAAKERLDFDTVVVTGVSGCLMGGVIAQALDVNLVVVRKPDDTSTHSWHRIEGYLGERWAFLDDLIDSGDTRRRVKRDLAAEVEKQNERRERARLRGARHVDPIRTRYVGSIEYQDGVVTAANGRRIFG